MPFKSDAQRRLMEGAAHDPAFAAKVGVPQATAQKFVADSSKQPRPHTEAQKAFFKRKGFVPSGGIIEAERAGSKTRPTQ